MATQTAERPADTQTPEAVVVRFAGDSGDGMQLTGGQFTLSTALAGNDLATFPDFPAEIRAPQGTLFGVSAFQINFGSRQINTAGDAPDAPWSLRAGDGRWTLDPLGISLVPVGLSAAEVDDLHDVLRRAVSTMQRQPQLAEAVITALTSDDEAAGRASTSSTDVMTRVMLEAFPDDVDPATEAAIAKVLGHVWFSCMVAWKNGVGDMTWMAEELRTAADLLCGHLG